MYDQYVNETLSVDNGASVAMCHHESIDQELMSQKFCDLVNEVIKSHYFYYHTIDYIIFWITFFCRLRDRLTRILCSHRANLTHFSCPSSRYMLTSNNCRLALR